MDSLGLFDPKILPVQVGSTLLTSEGYILILPVQGPKILPVQVGSSFSLSEAFIQILPVRVGSSLSLSDSPLALWQGAIRYKP